MQGSPRYAVPPVELANLGVVQISPSANNQIAPPARNPNINAGGPPVRHPNKKKPELRLMKFEMKLFISYFRLDKILEIFQGGSSDGSIESDRAKEIFRKIAVGEGNRKVNVGAFIDSMKTNGRCNTISLISSAILVSDAGPEEKAKILFNMYGDINTGKIDLNSIKMIIASGLIISIGHLPNLIEKAEKFLAVKKYTEKLKRVKDLYSQVILKSVSEHGECFQKETFIGLFVNKFSFLMKSSSIRIFAHSLYEKNKAG